MHRFIAACIVLLFGVAAFAQQAPSQPSVFITTKADVIISVSKHSTGADIVEVSLVKRNYPSKLLNEQILRLGQYLGSNVRGLQIYLYQMDPKDSKLDVLKAKFAVSGIIDRENQTIRIEPILRAFAGAPDPYTIKGISLMLDGEAPVKNRTISKLNTSSVRAEAIFTDKMPAGIEYRFELLEQDPNKITFPDKHEEPEKLVKAPGGSKKGLIIGLFVAAAVALGALVYFSVLRSGTQPRSKPKR